MGDYGHTSPSTTAAGSDGSVTLDADTGTIPPPVRINRGRPTRQNGAMDAEIMNAMGDGGQGTDALVDVGESSYDAEPTVDRGVGDTPIPLAEDAMLTKGHWSTRYGVRARCCQSLSDGWRLPRRSRHERQNHGEPEWWSAIPG